MPRRPWTIETELCRLANEARKADALVALGLIKSRREPFDIREVEPWHRGGAETYCYVFDVLGPSGKRRLIIKALVAPTPGTPPSLQVRNWVQRRKRLDTFGVRTPRLYAAGNGVLLEDFIRHDSIDQLRQKARRGPIEPRVQFQLEDVCRRVYEAGFRPLSVLPNLRSAGGQFIWVDFGTDLGDPLPTALVRPCPRQILNRELETRVWSALGPSAHF